MQYPIFIHKDPNSDFGVTIPDLPGCFSAGNTDEYAQRHGSNRSAFLADAAMCLMAEHPA